MVIIEGRLHQDQKLFQPTKVRVKRAFFVGGKPLKIGDEVMVEAHLARDLVAVGKAELA